MANRRRRIINLCCWALISLKSAMNMAAQGPIFQYFYDDVSQLTKVVDSSGTVIEYVYDPVGNILQIKRFSVAPGTLAIFNFTPQRGGPGQTITIQGQAFNIAPANDTVQFNGSAATVLTATATTLTVTVPAAATTGPISVTVSGQTATSTTNFTVLPVPVISSLSRKSALLGASFPNARFPALTVTGINLTDSTFALAPATTPPAAVFGAPVIDPSGTSATMSLGIGNTTGTFALVATNSAGSSSPVLTKAKRFTIVDPRSTADTDGDGVPDAIEAIFGTDPLDSTSFPQIPSLPGQAQSAPFTVLNQSPRTTPITVEAESPAFVVLNSSSAAKTFEAESLAFVVLNGSSAQTSHEAESPAFVVLNSNSATKSFEAESPAFVVLNSNAQVKAFEAESPAFTLLNGTASQASREAESPGFTLKNLATHAEVKKPQPTVKASLQKRQRTIATKRQPAKRVSKIASLSKASKNQKGKLAVPIASSEPTGAGSSASSFSDKNSPESNSQQGATHANQNQ